MIGIFHFHGWSITIYIDFSKTLDQVFCNFLESNKHYVVFSPHSQH